MHASFSFQHSNLQLAYTTQAWIFEIKTHAMQANICNAHSNAPYKFMSLLPPSCVLKILIDPLSPNVQYSPITHIFVSLPLCQQLAQKVSSNYR